MDIATHLLTGAAISTAFENPTLRLVTIIGSVAPDVGLVPIYLHKMKATMSVRIDRFVKYIGDDDPYPPPRILMNTYFLFHSVALACFMMVAGIWIPALLAFGLGYLSHILLDIPTHTGTWANRPLYPFSKKTLRGVANWWHSHHMSYSLIPLWILLGGLVVLLW